MCRFAPCCTRLAALIAFLALLSIPDTSARAQVPGDQAGVFASGSVSYIFRICSTCPEPTGLLDSGSDGGFGSFGQSWAGSVWAAMAKGASRRGH